MNWLAGFDCDMMKIQSLESLKWLCGEDEMVKLSYAFIALLESSTRLLLYFLGRRSKAPDTLHVRLHYKFIVSIDLLNVPTFDTLIHF